MSVTRYHCPECGASWKPTRREARTSQGECPECGALVEGLRERRPVSWGVSGNTRVLVVVGVVLGVLLVVVVLVVCLQSGGGGPGTRGPKSLDDPRVRRESFANAQAELTLSDLEALLGPGRKVSFEELPLKERASEGEEDRAKLRELARKYRIRSWYLWKGKDRWAYAGFRTNQSSIVAWRYRTPEGHYEGSLHDSENTLP
jgi:hypothetical protein